MENYKYKVSVIVPVYNVEKYLRKCLESLVKQTMPYNDMEVLLINDGSTDNSLSICHEYADIFPMFKVFTKENEGFSETRNLGIKNALGKYIMFLDSDDMLKEDTVESVTDYFDTVYEEVDVVCYRDQAYINGKKMPLHFRYKYLVESGVYDLNQYPFITQTRISVAVKNMFEKNEFFSVDEKVGHEDQRYLNSILNNKMKIGYCSAGEYMYNRSNETSIMHEKFYPLYLYENTIDYYEKLFGRYENEVPRYFQAYYLHDLSWKLKENILFPYHLEGIEYDNAIRRMKRLLDKVDDDIILSCPSTDKFHRHFFMRWKQDRDECSIIANSQKVSVYKKNRVIISESQFEVCLYKFVIENNNMRMISFVKSAIFNYLEKPNVSMLVCYEDGKKEELKLDLQISSESYYKSKTKTNNFWQFCFEHPIDAVQYIQVRLEIDGEFYPTKYWFAPTAPFVNSDNSREAIYKNHKVKFEKDKFWICKLSSDEIKNSRKNNSDKFLKQKEIYTIRMGADTICGRKIWLYYDCIGVDKDNGWYQFQYDIKKNDGIERYYINANQGKIFEEKYKDYIIQFGSIRHKIMYIAAEKIITAYIESENICPFDKNERMYFADISHAQVIYLQHGVLHAHLPWKYSPARIEADKIVISSKFEENNFVNNYKFRTQDLIPVGMERFDFINKDKPQLRRILFAPSWRNYLIGSKNGNEWNYTDEKFIKSDYFINFNNFLNSPKLEKVLKDNDVYLDFKIHPIFKHYSKYFENSNSHVTINNEEYKDDEYAMYITDFSSYVFNFAYMSKYIVYFVPDWMQFISGMNQYRELDLPFEKAFGPMVKNEDDAIREIERAINSNFQPEKLFRERMENFFLPMQNNRENLYEYLIKN